MHEINYIWVNYFWASLKGNGPEALVQTAVYALIALIVIPPFRHWVSNHIHALHVKLDAQHKEHIRVLTENHRKQMDTLKTQHNEVLKHVSSKTPAKPEPTKAPARPRARGNNGAESR